MKGPGSKPVSSRTTHEVTGASSDLDEDEARTPVRGPLAHINPLTSVRVVPELQRRGRYKSADARGTMREVGRRLGLEVITGLYRFPVPVDPLKPAQPEPYVEA